MADPRIVAIRVRRGNAVFNVHGDNAGREGVWLAAGQVNGIYEAPIKSTWKTGAFQTGSTQKAVKRLHRDMELGFHVIDTISNAFEWNESAFRQIFFYEEDQWAVTPKKTIIEVVTELSGVRKLDVLMYEQPDFSAAVDPIMQQYGNLILKLRAGHPMWYQDDEISEFSSSATNAGGVVYVSNPTDQVMWHKWILTPGIWTLPDFQWVGDPGEREPGGAQKERYITDIPVTIGNGGAVVDLDRSNLMYRDFNNTNLLAQMGGGKIFTFPIPPYTPEYPLPVSYKGAPGGGATCQLVMPRKWSRPYGLEAVTVLNTLTPKDLTFRFNFPGSFEFKIPMWAERLDIVAVGGGGGGEGGGIILPGSGGSAGSVAYRTVIRGVDIPWDTPNIVGTIGSGGAGGAPWFYGIEEFGGGVDGQPGTETSVVASGMATVGAAGGIGGKYQAGLSGAGITDVVLNGKTYVMGHQQDWPSYAGGSPGGGGSGGWGFIGGGGPGGNGQVWIRAYGWAGS